VFGFFLEGPHFDNEDTKAYFRKHIKDVEDGKWDYDDICRECRFEEL